MIVWLLLVEAALMLFKLGLSMDLTLFKLGHSMDLMVFSIGLQQACTVLLRFHKEFGQRTCMENTWIEIGPCTGMVNFPDKLGPHLQCMVDISNKLGLQWQSTVDISNKLGLRWQRMEIYLNKLGLRVQRFMMAYMDTLGLILWQVAWSLHGVYMTVGVEILVRFLNMVWGEVEWEMECQSFDMKACGVSRRGA